MKREEPMESLLGVLQRVNNSSTESIDAVLLLRQTELQCNSNQEVLFKVSLRLLIAAI